MTDGQFPIGRHISLPGHFAETVLLESVRPLGEGHECRVRLPDGSREGSCSIEGYTEGNPLSPKHRLVKIQNPYHVLEHAEKHRQIIRRYEIPADAIDAQKIKSRTARAADR